MKLNQVASGLCVVVLRSAHQLLKSIIRRSTIDGVRSGLSRANRSCTVRLGSQSGAIGRARAVVGKAS